MPITFNQVPDWTSWENQDGDVAVADLDQDGAGFHYFSADSHSIQCRVLTISVGVDRILLD